ncbi:MAG: sulfite exporter TauE/SafE family protein [Deltaproteobacteria bacterium]|nr:sulfite exporter TauE/SafE family protein [Deltaproteobacteria bacterium]
MGERLDPVSNNLLAQISIPCSTSLFMGIAAGLGHCGVVCTPFVSTYIMGSREGSMAGLNSFITFTVGKVFMCGVLGLAAGCIGTAFLNTGNLRYVSTIHGAVMISIGLLMLIGPVCLRCEKTEEKNRMPGFLLRRFTFNSTTHLFVMGMAFAVIPCQPMGAMLLYSLRMPSVISSSILMILFGIGTAISPLIIISAAAGWFSKKIKSKAPHHRMLFQRVSGMILILLGGFSAAS